MKFFNMDYETFCKLMIQPSTPLECINLTPFDKKNYKNSGCDITWWYLPKNFDGDIDYSEWFIELLNWEEIIHGNTGVHSKSIKKSDVLKIIKDPSDFSYEEFVLLIMVLDT